MLLLKQVIASVVAQKQSESMRFVFKKGAAPGIIPQNASPEIIDAQRWQACLDVLDELSKEDYKYYTVEMKVK